MPPSDHSLSDYDYQLPSELIAQQPLPTRTDSRLLVVKRATGHLDHSHIRDIGEFLQPGDCLVLNNTLVLPARIVGYRTLTGGKWQGLFLSVDKNGVWSILSKTRGKLEVGETVTLRHADGGDAFKLRLLMPLDGGAWAAQPEIEGTHVELLERVGRVPLPHYIRDGEMMDADKRTYQTVFAENAGSIAAPTAGLHFTEELLTSLQEAGVRIAKVTLHVGIGTFRPIACENLAEHMMHSEWGEVTSEAAESIKSAQQSGGRIISVGTTSVRVLESASANGQIEPWSGETDLFIRPPYHFKTVDCLLTNFHLPKSTLLVLVRTLGGDDTIKRAYAEAIAEEYRFFSYGDAMLIV